MSINVRAYNVFLRDTDLSRIGEFNEYTKLEMRLVFAGVSRWVLEVAADSDMTSLIKYGRGIIVQRNGQIILSGPIDRIEQDWSENSNSITISGPDDTTYLQDRWTTPVVAGPPYTAQAYDVLTGVASTVMRYYVNSNVGGLATVARRKSGLIVELADPLVGSVVTGRARFDNLLVFLQTLALAGGDLGFQIVQSPTTNELIFRVYQPVDHTDDIIFSPQFGNLRAFNYSTTAPEANYIIVAGGGEGTARSFYEQGDSDSIALLNRRIELFVDRRDTTVVAELTQTAIKELASKGISTSLSITPIDTDSLAYGVDYNLGDRVTVVTGVGRRIFYPSYPGGYRYTVLNDHPKGYWRLGELTGLSANDESGNGNTGTIVGGVTLGQVGALNNDADTAMLFNGSTGHITIPANAVFDTPSFTVETWIKPTATVGDIVHKNGATRWRFFIDVASPLRLQFDGLPGDVGNAISTGLLPNVWAHVVGTYDHPTTTWCLYINGELKDTKVATFDNTVSSSLDIGQSNAAGYFSGTLDEVKLYSTALSAERILAHYNAGLNSLLSDKYQPPSIISSVPPSITIQDVVRSINISLDADNGEVILPSIGTADSGKSGIIGLYNRLNQYVSRISNLERR